MSVAEKFLVDKHTVQDREQPNVTTVTPDQLPRQEGQGRRSEEADRFLWVTRQLTPLMLLSENWDGYGAASPHKGTLDLARAFLIMLAKNDCKEAPDISATRTGGVAFTWEHDNRRLEIEFLSPQRFDYELLDCSSRKRRPGTFDLETTPEDELASILVEFFSG